MLKKLVLCATAIGFSALTLLADNKDWGQIERYDAANKAILADKGRKVRVVFIGNSITDNWAAWRPEFFDSHNFVGRGISGQTSYQFLVRFREDVINLSPEVVVINVGTNDIAENTGPYNEDRTFGNIQSLVELARANGIKVILTTVLPAKAFGWRPSVTDGPDKIKRLNNRIARYAAVNNIPFVDYYTALVAPDGISLPAELSGDGVHPTHAGYEIMESTVLPVIETTLK